MRVFQTYEKLFDFVAVRYRIKVRKTAWSDHFIDRTQIQPVALKNLIPFIAFGYGVILTFCYLFFEAQTFLECSESIYPISTTIVNICNYSVLFSNRAEIFEFIDDIENVIKKREFNSAKNEIRKRMIFY